MALKRSLLAASVVTALACSVSAKAGTFTNTEGDSSALTLQAPLAAEVAPSVPKAESNPQSSGFLNEPIYLDAAAASGPNIHGFLDLPFKTAYITPRGLVVQNEGLVFQPLAGMVIPIGDLGVAKDFALVAGVWNSVNTANGDPRVGAWDEMDVFVGFGFKVTKEVKIDFDYEAWNFPASTLNKPNTEHVFQLKVSYDDSKWWGQSGFSICPYVNFFYEIGGSSTVVLGNNGQTGYVELGAIPCYAFKAPFAFTISAPTYISMGPKDFWGRNDSALTKPDGNFGVFSTGVCANVPLSFIPAKYGNWHAEAGILYYHLINDALVRAGTLLSGNDRRDVFNGFVGIGMGF